MPFLDKTLCVFKAFLKKTKEPLKNEEQNLS